MLALTIDMQNSLFEVFEQLLTARIEGAIAAGIYDRGLETLAADSLIVKERRTVYTHPATGRADPHLHHRPPRPQPAADAGRGARPRRSPRRPGC